MWKKNTLKPSLFEPVLLLTKLDYLIEGFWDGKRWVNSYNHSVIECRKWLPLKILEKIYVKKRKKRVNPAQYIEKTGKFHHLRRVKYENGKMICL